MTSLSKQPNSSQPRLAVLLLAAGEGSRLGSSPKALLQKNGQSLLKRFCLSTTAFSPTQLLVVTGYHAQAIEAELTKLKQEIPIRIEWVRNPSPELGQASSVRLGLETLSGDYDVLLVALCDQPLVGTHEIAALLEQFAQRDSQKEIILPMVDGQRGNPVMFSRKVIAQILAIEEMVCRPFMDRHPDLVQTFVTDNLAYIADVDTEADISKFNLQRTVKSPQ